MNGWREAGKWEGGAQGEGGRGAVLCEAQGGLGKVVLDFKVFA